MTEAMPFLRNTILLSYDTRSFSRGRIFYFLSNRINSKLDRHSSIG